MQAPLTPYKPIVDARMPFAMSPEHDGQWYARADVDPKLTALRAVADAAREFSAQISQTEIDGGMNWRAADAVDALRAALAALESK